MQQRYHILFLSRDFLEIKDSIAEPIFLIFASILIYWFFFFFLSLLGVPPNRMLRDRVILPLYKRELPPLRFLHTHRSNPAAPDDVTGTCGPFPIPFVVRSRSLSGGPSTPPTPTARWARAWTVQPVRIRKASSCPKNIPFLVRIGPETPRYDTARYHDRIAEFYSNK